jgi:ribose 5-phosphate isomerase RpiB
LDAAPERDIDPDEQKNRANIARVKTSAGTEVETRYRLVSANDLKTSHNTNYEVNPEYPAELQPRQRNRNASIQQIESILSKLDPSLLGESRLASDGAPIVGHDGIVESGNGRTIALKAMYERGEVTQKEKSAYLRFLHENAEKFGFKPSDLAKVKNPILVRERLTDIDRATFTREANESNIASMSSSETAMSDAKKLTGEMLSAFDTDKEVANNRDFLRLFVEKVVPENERGTLLDENGRISQDGLRRVRNALFAKAYNNSNVLGLMAEATDQRTRDVVNALVQGAPRIAAIEEGIAAGRIKPELSISKDITNAITVLERLRKNDEKVHDYLAQRSLFEEELSDDGKKLLEFFDANKFKGNRIAAFLTEYAGMAERALGPSDLLLFDDAETAAKSGLIESAIERANNPSGQMELKFFRERHRRSIRKADTVQEATKIMNQKTPEGKAARELYNKAKSRAKDAGMSEKEAQAEGFRAVVEKAMEDEEYYQFAGEKAATVAVDDLNLEYAKGMGTLGFDNELIRRKTGWFKGMDGMWRFEIPDDREKMNFDFGLEEARPLGEVYDNKMLYKAYPSLKDTKVQFAPHMGNMHGIYKPDSNTILLNPDLPLFEKQKTLAHEIQHAIQDIEDFARGGNPSMFKEKTVVTLEAKRIQTKMERLLRDYPEYAEVVTRIRELEAEKKDKFRTPESQNSIRFEKISKELKRLQKIAEKEYGHIHPEYERLELEYEKETKISPFRQYENLAGEIEARDTGNRSFIGKKYLKTIPPDLRGDAVITYNGRVLSSYSAEETRTDAEEGFYQKGIKRPPSGESPPPRPTGEARRYSDPEPPERGDDEVVPRTTILEIREAVEDIVPFRTGTGHKDKRILGLYKAGSVVTRTQFHNDLVVEAHEIGHHVERTLNLLTEAFYDDAAQKELLSAGKPSAGEDYSRAQTAEEGAAQFMTRWLSNDEQARRDFPRYYEMFTDALAKKPELEAKLNRLKTLVTNYYKQTEQERLDANIISGGERKARTFREKVDDIANRLYFNFVDSAAPLKRVQDRVKDMLGVEYLPDELNLYARARTFEGWRGPAGESVNRLMAPIRELSGVMGGEKGHTALKDYLTAQRAQDYRDNGLEPGVDSTDAGEKGVIAKTSEAVKHAADKLRGAWRGIVHETLVDSGIMSEEQWEYYHARWPHYVPFMRVNDTAGLEEDIHRLMRGRGRGFVDLPNPIRQAKGVEDPHTVRPITDPIQAMIANVNIFHSLAARNNVGEVLVNLSKQKGMGWLAEPLKHYTPKSRDDAVFHVWVNGKKKFFATDPDIYEALTAMGGVSYNIEKALKPLETLNKMFIGGVTRYDPSFWARNFIRDSQSAAINSFVNGGKFGPGSLPVLNTIQGIMVQTSKDPEMEALFRRALKAGIAYSGITSQVKEYTPEGIQKALQKAFDAGSRSDKTLDMIEAAFNVLGDVNEAVELAPKFAEFVRLKKEGVPEQEAVLMAREVNTDFGRSGKAGRVINKYTPFFNAGIQGVDKAARNARGHPMRTAMAALLFVGLPRLLAYAFGHRDKEAAEKYDGLSRSIKDTNHVFSMGDTEFKIPVPQEYGPMIAILERTFDYIYKEKPQAFRGLWGTLAEAGVPNLAPVWATTIVEVLTNHNFFTGRPVVGRKYEGLPPEFQYSPSTSGVAKILGLYTGMSPMKIDHVLRGFGGNLPLDTLKAAGLGVDWITGHSGRESAKASEVPWIRSFLVDSVRQNEDVDVFYDLAEKADEEKKRYTLNRRNGARANKYVTGAPKFREDREKIWFYSHYR